MSACLVVPRERLELLRIWGNIPELPIPGGPETLPRQPFTRRQGVVELTRDQFNAFVAFVNNVGKYRERGTQENPQVENKPQWQQIIPYIIIQHGETFFFYQRTTTSDEAKLRERVSVGIGGHAKSTDGTILNAALREANEELVITADGQKTNFTLDNLGQRASRFILIKDDSDPVGTVHTGLGMMLCFSDIANLEITTSEPDQLSPKGFLTVEQYREWVGDPNVEAENWTSLVIDHLTACPAAP